MGKGKIIAKFMHRHIDDILKIKEYKKSKKPMTKEEFRKAVLRERGEG